jgi:uncharacterized protein YeaO (DUF488 family)
MAPSSYLSGRRKTLTHVKQPDFIFRHPCAIFKGEMAANARTAGATTGRLKLGEKVMIYLQRVYEPAAGSDGKRFLVERLWPRGVKKTALPMTAWLKEVAPSPPLRQWFNHDPAKWEEFRRRYRAELAAQPAAWRTLMAATKTGSVTLLYGARDQEHNSARVLKQFLEEQISREKKSR